MTPRPPFGSGPFTNTYRRTDITYASQINLHVTQNQNIMRKTLFSICLTLLFVNCFAQNRFTARAYFGLSDLRFILPKGVKTFGGPEYAPYYSWKAGIYYDLMNSKSTYLYPTVGLSLTGRTTRQFHRDQNDILMLINTDKYYTLDLPLELHYRIYKCLELKSGLNGRFLIMANAIPSVADMQLFTYGFSVGASLQFNRYSIYLEYNRDLNDILKHILIENSSWRFSSIYLAIGYRFSSVRQVKGIIRSF